MPVTQVTRTREIGRDTCILDFTGNASVRSGVWDATTLSADSNGFYYPPPFTFVTLSTSDPTKIKAFENLGSNTNAQQTLTLTGTPTGGTFTLTFNGQTTAPISYNASSAAVSAALAALSNIGSTANIAVTGGALEAAPIVVQFEGFWGNQPVALMTANSSGLTGGTSPVVTPTTSVTGTSAEKIIGVFDNLEYDFAGNASYDDEPVPFYSDFCVFNTQKLNNWYAYGALAVAALPTCSFWPKTGSYPA